jgi:hypothetical protein
MLQDTHTLTHIHILPQNSRRSSPVMIRLRNAHLCQHYRSGHHLFCVRTHGTLYWVTWDMFRSSDRILWQVPWPICCCCDFNYRWGLVGMHQHCNFLDLEFSSDRSWPTDMLIMFQTVSPLCETFVPLDHSLIIWNIFLADLPNFLQNLTFARCPNCDILDFCCLQTTTLHNSDFLSEYTACMQLLLAGMREERTQDHLVAPRICCKQCRCAANPRNYWLYCVLTGSIYGKTLIVVTQIWSFSWSLYDDSFKVMVIQYTKEINNSVTSRLYRISGVLIRQQGKDKDQLLAVRLKLRPRHSWSG